MGILCYCFVILQTKQKLKYDNVYNIEGKEGNIEGETGPVTCRSVVECYATELCHRGEKIGFKFN